MLLSLGKTKDYMACLFPLVTRLTVVTRNVFGSLGRTCCLSLNYTEHSKYGKVFRMTCVGFSSSSASSDGWVYSRFIRRFCVWQSRQLNVEWARVDISCANGCGETWDILIPWESRQFSSMFVRLSRVVEGSCPVYLSLVSFSQCRFGLRLG